MSVYNDLKQGHWVRNVPPLEEPAPHDTGAQATPTAIVLADALLPVEDEQMRVVVFGIQRSPEVFSAEVAALMHVAPKLHEVPLVRVHSACLTGDVFGSEKCDCGAQLKAALHVIRETQSGVLLYMLRHEGRGIGLTSKIQAYHLQDEGLDTIAANLALGLPVDARDYGSAAAALLQLGITEIDLLTNNPDKIESLLEHGITIRERVAIGGYTTPHNLTYLAVKDDQMGHLGAGLCQKDVPTEDGSFRDPLLGRQELDESAAADSEVSS